MSRILTSDKLVESVRKRAMIPDDTSVYKDADILDILNEEMDAGLLSTLITLHEEYLVCYEDILLESGKTKYAIPYRAVGNKLREVSYVSSSGEIYELSRISVDQLSDYRRASSTHLFYVENNFIVLVNDGGGIGQYLRMYYYLRPNTIVDIDECGKITNINRTTGVITLNNFPDTFATLDLMDFVGARTPNKIYKFDVQPTSVDSNTNTVTFAVASIPEELLVGDYLCMKEQTPVPNVPTEMHPLLAQRAAVHMLEALGDSEGLGNARAKLQSMEQAIGNLIDNRVEGAPQKISPRHSTLFETSSYGRYRRRGSIF